VLATPKNYKKWWAAEQNETKGNSSGETLREELWFRLG
jgi:hypothetical protein